MAKEDHHMVQKGQAWFVQLAIPSALQAQFNGKRLLAKSLKTSDRLEARRRRNTQLQDGAMGVIMA